MKFILPLALLFSLSSAQDLCPVLRLNDAPFVNPDDPLHCSKPAVTLCVVALQLSGFDATDVGNYNQWYDPNGYVHVAQTGVYENLDGITEYLTFGLLSGPYFDTGATTNLGLTDAAGNLLPDRIPKILSADGNQCELGFVTNYIYDLNSPKLLPPELNGDILTKGGLFTVPVLGVYEYTYDLSAQSININKLRGFYPANFWVEFAEKFDTKDFRAFLCSIMKDNCRSVWDANGYENHQQCREDIESLPYTDDLDYIGGGWKTNSLGCRQLHLAFVAAGNSIHCPHISFTPIPDTNGSIKCQPESDDSVSPESLINAEEFNFFYTVVYELFGPFGYDGKSPDDLITYQAPVED